MQGLPAGSSRKTAWCGGEKVSGKDVELGLESVINTEASTSTDTNQGTSGEAGVLT